LRARNSSIIFSAMGFFRPKSRQMLKQCACSAARACAFKLHVKLAL